MHDDELNPVRPFISVHPDVDAVGEASARRFVELARDAANSGGRFTVALSGGSTPRHLYATLAREPYCGQVPWAVTHIFWGDERHVPNDSSESNYRLAQETLLRHVPLPPDQVHPIPTDLSPGEAAAAYTATLRSVLGEGGLDLVLLGMGADGHVASLFPGADALRAAHRGAVALFVRQLESWRVTLTLPEINAARAVVFLVTGEEKASAVADVSSGHSSLPAAWVNPVGGQVVWMLDRAAAAQVVGLGGGGTDEDTTPLASVEALKRAASEAAADLVESGMTIGLGTGSTARYVIEAVGNRLERDDLKNVVAVPTSGATAELARLHGIPLGLLDETTHLDLAIDGTDEVSPNLDLIKGLGAALLREKIVAAAARRFVVVADGRKRVTKLGTRAPLPLAVVPFGWAHHLNVLRELGAEPELRLGPDGSAVVTDDGLWLIDCRFAGGIEDPESLDRTLHALPGIVETGLFLGMARAAFIAEADGVQVIQRE